MRSLRSVISEPRLGRVSARQLALWVSVVWLVMVAGFWLFVPGAGGISAVGLIAVGLPLGLIWMAAGTAQALADLRGEADSLRQQLAAMAPGAGPAGHPAAPQTPPTPQTAPAPSTPAPQPAPAQQPQQASLALDMPPEGQAVAVGAETLIRALNFPDGPEDAAGRAALRAALGDKDAARLIRAAQDVLTLLAQDGVFMDDLIPDRARPELWRRFAQGTRGREIAALGGVRDADSLSLATGALREDAVFRDAAHHFLRQFDRALAAFEPGADDAQIAALAETRTARAFMLLGRATGVFD